MEGLRVVEEFTRMHLNDKFLTEETKQLRHALADLTSKIGGERLLESRDILHDVGTEVAVETEYSRDSLESVLRANCGRVLQSLRSMEEYSKLLEPPLGAGFEELRYKTYSLEKAIVGAQQSRDQIADAAIYVLVSVGPDFKRFETLVVGLVESGVDFIQLRDKNLNDRELVAAGQLISGYTRSKPTRWIMNDRADLAVIAHADGVHVGQDDLPVAEARRIVGPEKLIGVSTHDIDQARQAVLAGASYIGVGPCFQSQTKSFDEFASDQFIQSVTNEISLPAFAIGGINPSNVSNLIELGIKRFAIGRSITDAESPADAVAAFRQATS